MEFKDFNKHIQTQFGRMCKAGKLFISNVTGQQVWDKYLESFLPENNNTFRDPESSEHNCNCCKQFIRRYGNILAINEQGDLESIFSNIDKVGEYTESVKACAELLENSEIKDVFFESYSNLDRLLTYESCNKQQKTYKLGFEVNYKEYNEEEIKAFPNTVKQNKVYEFHHFFINLPKQFVHFGSESLEALTAKFRDKYSVFKRAMEEIPLDTLNLVRDLINQGSLLDGTAHLFAIEQYIKIWNDLVPGCPPDRDNWYWNQSYNMDERVAKFKNTLIGVLCTELAEGIELNKACLSWNKRVDPSNYHKATAPITQKQINEAQKFVEENGYTESFNRRLATIKDIRVDEILHSNVGDSKIKPISIFDNVKATSTRHKKSQFDNVEEVSIEKFMLDILPNCSSIEVYLENRMTGNLVTMTTGEGKPIFKWDNNYSWTFNGNLAGKSQLRDAVKSRGGNIEGVLNIRLAFPETTDDYDLRMVEPGGNHIYYANVRKRQPSSGMLDLDAQGVDGHQNPEKRVENIAYSDLSKMPNGDYRVYVNDYSGKGFRADFLIEIENPEGLTTATFNCNNARGSNADVAIITLKNGEFTIKLDPNMDLGESKTVSKELWGLETNNFHKVNLACLSPNHWGENKVGNLHYMFMLEGCKADSPIRGFHNENLIPELLKHKKVMEVLGNTVMIEPNGKHLAGLAFNSTVKDELIVKVKGTHQRVLKIKF